MPYETIWEENGVFQRFFGQITRDERMRASSEIHGDSRFDTIRYWIIDSLDIDSYDLGKSDAEILANTDNAASRTNPSVLMPIVCTHIIHRNNFLHYLIHLKKAGSPWMGKLFDNVKTARQWISMPATI